ncbi:ESAG8, partial [Symbiodinium natans]
MVAAPLLPRWALTLAAVAPLVFPCVLCGTGPAIQRPWIGATAEGGSLDCHSICGPADDADSREVKAIEFLKTLWLPGDTNATIPEANTRKYLSSFFSVFYDNATRVRDLAIKHPPPGGALVTASQMSCALRCLAHLRGLFVDNSGIAGALGDLFLPEHLVELHARECPLRGALADLNLQNPLKGLKLSGKNPRDIYGDLHDLKEFIWDRLEFLDFRGASSITGNLSALVSALDIRRLRGVFLQYTSVTGDITQLLRANKLMTWLDLRGTRAYGSINSEWLDLGQDLIYLRLSNSRVTFNMDEPAIVKDKRTAKKPFPRLARLDLNGCPLNMDIWDLLLPLMYNDKLFWLQAEGCGLRGAIQ